MDEEEKTTHNAVNELITLRDKADEELAESERQASDLAADMQEMSDDREDRTYAAMQALDPLVAKDTMDIEKTPLTEEERQMRAAVVIQSHYRGYIDRCKFLEMLYDQYEKEEQERKARAADQCEEGELLVANHQLEVEIQDSETAIRNKHRLYISRIVTIQRAWRHYLKRKRDQLQQQSAEDENSPTLRRKNDILNQAQEFADLKRQCEEALPYNAHKATLLSDSSLESSTSSNISVNSPSTESLKSIANKSPEHKSKSNPFNKTKSCESGSEVPVTQTEKNISIPPTASSNSSKSVKDAHREDVRKRLAMNTPAEGTYGDVYTRASNSKPYRAQNSAMELYVNDCNEEGAVSAHPGNPTIPGESDGDIIAKQQRLHEEATVAYIQAGPIARRLIEVEKLAEEPSEIARMLGISTFRSQGDSTLTKKRLDSLTLPQLQIVFQAIQNEIEKLNEELVECVVSRDELHMQQDSILVNIEDLQRRIEELSAKHSKKVEQKEAKRSASKTSSAAQSSTKSDSKTSASSRVSRLFRLGKT